MARAGLDLDKIIHTAIEIADHEGIEALTLATLARKLSVKPPSLFNHINGLPSLKRELSLLGLTKLYEVMKKAGDGKERDEALMSVAKAYLEFTRKHPGLYELTIKAPDENDVEMVKVSNEIIYLLIQILKAYNLDEEYTIHTIRGLRSILHGFSSLEQKQAFGMSINVEKSFEILIQTFISNLNMNNKSVM